MLGAKTHMADDAGVAAEQAAPGALAGAAQIARRHDRVRTKGTCASPCLVARMQLPGQSGGRLSAALETREGIHCCVALEAGRRFQQQAMYGLRSPRYLLLRSGKALCWQNARSTHAMRTSKDERGMHAPPTKTLVLRGNN